MSRTAVLHVIGGNDRGKQFELARPETKIGRGVDQDVMLTDIAVSRRHVTIFFDPQGYRLQDLGSGNGTLLNGTRVDTALLKDGDQIELGNTLFRFEQPNARAQPAPLQPAPPAQAPPVSPPVHPASPQMLAPSAPLPLPPPPGPPPVPAQSLSALQRPPPPVATGPVPAPPPSVPAPSHSPTYGFAMPLPTGMRLGPARGPFDTLLKQVLVFGGMGIVFIVSLAVVLGHTGKRPPATSNGEQLYREGLRQFAAGEYDAAKLSFGEALVQVPDSSEVKHYLERCDVESHAHTALASARRELAAHRYADALRALDAVDTTSLVGDTARQLRQQAAPRAAAEEAGALAARLRTEPAVPPETGHLGHSTESTREHGAHGRSADSAPALAEPRAVLVAYRVKDFGGAEQAWRAAAATLSGARAAQALGLAKQMHELKTVYARAVAEETRLPAQAIRDYEEALSIDARVGHGLHSSYFKSKLGKLEVPYARTAFAEGKYDLAFQAATAAQRYGAGDGGVLRQLEAKANQLLGRGVELERTNPAQAKIYWRTVIRMVPTSSASYQRAYALLSSSGGAHRDEDEE